jgi:hypothetical protein
VRKIGYVTNAATPAEVKWAECILDRIHVPRSGRTLGKTSGTVFQIVTKPARPADWLRTKKKTPGTEVPGAFKRPYSFKN